MKKPKQPITKTGLRYEKVNSGNRCVGCKAAYNNELCKQLPLCSIIENNIQYPIVWK